MEALPGDSKNLASLVQFGPVFDLPHLYRATASALEWWWRSADICTRSFPGQLM